MQHCCRQPGIVRADLNFMIRSIAALLLTPLLTLIAPFAILAAELPTNCDTALQVKYTVLHRNYIKANGVAVTGEFLYPLETVLTNLGLENKSQLDRLKDKKVLSLAEGTSELVPYLLSQGIAAQGLDLWYGDEDYPDNWAGREMRAYYEKYKPYLIRADARNIPAADASYDFILSHMLMNNLSYPDRSPDMPAHYSVLYETLRVLKKGGEARFFGIREDAKLKIERELKDLGIQYKMQKIEFTVASSPEVHTSHLLIIYK